MRKSLWTNLLLRVLKRLINHLHWITRLCWSWYTISHVGGSASQTSYCAMMPFCFHPSSTAPGCVSCFPRWSPSHFVGFLPVWLCTAIAVPTGRLAYFSWLPASYVTELEISCEILRNIQIYSCLHTYKSDIFTEFLSFILSDFRDSLISCEQSSQARGEKASLALRLSKIANLGCSNFMVRLSYSLESFRALKISRLESFRVRKYSFQILTL